MLENIKVLCHSSIRIEKEKIIYIDPFRINQNYNDADIIMITHSHYDHYSEEDIQKVKKKDSYIIVPEDLFEKVQSFGFNEKNIVIVKPNESYEICGVKLSTVPAYNVNKKFHPKENNWVGYLIELENVKYYIAGDTDITEENKKVKCDVAFVPVGGTYTMTAKEASSLINTIKPKVAVPIHYGEVVGTIEDARIFKDNLDLGIECKILMD